MTLTDSPATGVVESVVLVDPDGQPLGVAPKASVHTTKTPLHLAFSLHLFAGDPLAPTTPVLLTRRALGKATWPGVWTNSCCGHPAPGEPMEAAVRRRLTDELGVRADELTDLRCVLPDFAYRATDASGVVENEVCPVYVARLAPGVHPDQVVRANTAEVSEWAWVEWSAATTAILGTPFAFSPWAVSQVRRLSPPVGATRSAGESGRSAG